ncbi:MAG: ABC transporter ATP-binding protein [Deltaproteobacteria bacterium]|nr:ABC transporter ATP-binding protein [Candidatus Anaeroferrophillacea bacterium]
MSAALVFDRVHKTFRRTGRRPPIRALNDFSLTVGSGDCFAFLGLNGAGKSTALKVLVGLCRPDAGRAAPVGATPEECRRRLGYMADTTAAFNALSPEPLLVTAGRLGGLSRVVARERARELLGFVGLAGAVGAVGRFSRGMRQRFSLALALMHDPDILVLDEPFSGLDILGRRAIIALLADLHRRGKTVFFTSHSIADVGRLATRCGVIHRGCCRGVWPVPETAAELERRFMEALERDGGGGP